MPDTGNGPRPQVTYSLDLDPRKESVQESRRTDVFMGAKEWGQCGGLGQFRSVKGRASVKDP